MKETKLNEYKLWIIQRYGIAELYLKEELELWKAKFSGAKSPESDFIWSMFNRLLGALPNSTNDLDKLYSEQREIFCKMHEFLLEEKKSTTTIRRAIHKCDLLRYQNSPYLLEIVIHSADCCEPCNTLNQKRLSPDDALEKQYLPNRKCTRYACICFYSTEAIRNEKGRLIMK